MQKKKGWIISVFLIALVTYIFVFHLEREMSCIEVIPDDPHLKPMLAENFPDLPSKWEFDDAQAFFVEYRLERERIRGQEIEMLDEMMNNAQVGEEARREAEQQMLNLTGLMEKELMVENMLKAQGYADALLFAGEGLATIMVCSEKLTEDDFLRIAESASALIGVPREQVQVIQHG
jgi:stage III sporulation protein AH